MLKEIITELDRATKKFPHWPDDPFVALAVLQEEVGELTKAVLQHTWEPAKGVTKPDIRAEAVQVAAMALRFLASIDCYDFHRCTQHAQERAGRPLPAPAWEPLGADFAAVWDAHAAERYEPSEQDGSNG